MMKIQGVKLSCERESVAARRNLQSLAGFSVGPIRIVSQYMVSLQLMTLNHARRLPSTSILASIIILIITNVK